MKAARATGSGNNKQGKGREPSSGSGDIYVYLVPDLLRLLTQDIRTHNQLDLVKRMECDPGVPHTQAHEKQATLRIRWDSATSQLGAASDKRLREDVHLISGMLKHVHLCLDEDIGDWSPSVTNLQSRFADFDVKRIPGNNEKVLVHRAVGPPVPHPFDYLQGGSR